MFKTLKSVFVTLPIVFILTSMASATTVHVYVDCNATEPGNGTEERPFQTISEAVPWGQYIPSGTVMHVHVASGIYRETVSRYGWKDFGIDLIIEGDPNDRPVILGSEPAQDWDHYENDIYMYNWQHDFYSGTPAYTEDNQVIKQFLYGLDPENSHRATYLMRRESVWVDGERLVQVLDSEDSAPGTFMINQHYDRLFARLADGSSPDNHEIEVSIRENCLDFTQMQNITISNLVIRYASVGISVRNTSSFTMENCLVEESAEDGILVSGADEFTIRNCEVINNGFSGMMYSTSENITMENVLLAENNWRGAIVDAGNWRLSGVKFFAVSNVQLTNVVARDNFTYGIWFDSYCDTIVMENCSMISNYASGFFWEVSPGPIQLIDCDIQYNGRAYREDWDLMAGGNGVMINSGANVSFINCDFVENTPFNIKIVNSGRTAPLWKDGAEGESDPIYVSGLEIAGGTFTHEYPMEYTIHVPEWLNREMFWTQSIDITPLTLAEQIIPEEYQIDPDDFEEELEFTLGAFPNPSNAAVVLSVDLPYTTDMRVELFDVLGRRVQSYSYSQLPQGLHRTHINGQDLASGTYFARVTAGEQQVGIQKIMFLK